MNIFLRWIIGTVIAAFVTFALFVMMMVLIKGDFEPQEKVKTESFEINPKVEDIKAAVRETKIIKVRKVETPPPPPQIERQKSIKPSVPIATLEGALPKFEAPKLDRASFKIVVSDRDAQPLLRIEPMMPTRAEKSGRCYMRFNVDSTGKTYDVEAYRCSSNVFKSNSLRAVSRWKYQPKIVDGAAVPRRGVETTLIYRQLDERGRLIPE